MSCIVAQGASNVYVYGYYLRVLIDFKMQPKSIGSAQTLLANMLVCDNCHSSTIQCFII